MSVVLDAGKKLPPALLSWLKKRVGVEGIGPEESLLSKRWGKLPLPSSYIPPFGREGVESLSFPAKFHPNIQA